MTSGQRCEPQYSPLNLVSPHISIFPSSGVAAATVLPYHPPTHVPAQYVGCTLPAIPPEIIAASLGYLSLKHCDLPINVRHDAKAKSSQ